MGRLARIVFLAILLIFAGTGYALGDQSLDTQGSKPNADQAVIVENSTDTLDKTAVDSLNSEQAARSLSPEVSRGSSAARSIISSSLRFIGTPYRYGGNSSRGFDCSGFVGHVFGMWDIKLPRSSREQAGLGKHIEKSDLIPADLVFFKTGGSSRINHVGIYLGDSRFIHASTSRGITISSLNEKYYLKAYYGARRILGL